MRAFAIEHFHHFAYLAIGVAMLGFGASGTVVAALRARADGMAPRWGPRAAALAGLAFVAGPAAAHLLPLDATRLALAPGEWVRLGVVCLALALPIGLAALGILLALTLEAGRPGTVYGASFLGAALGAAAALGALAVLTPSRALAVPALLASGAALALAGPRPWWAAAAALVSLLALARPPWRLAVTPYKGLPQAEAYPDARRVAERSSPLGWTVAVRAPALRYAPGLSLEYPGAFPPQVGLFVDGQIAGAASDWVTDPGAERLLDWLPSAVPYALGSRDRVLVLGAGDGLEVWSALAHGATRVTAVELSPDLVELLGDLSSPSPVGDPRVHWRAADARSYVARTDERFDLVTLAPGGAPGGAAAGIHALNEDFMHTVEAYRAYLARLTDGGVLAVTRWVTVPPRSSVRVILTAAEALRGAVRAPVGRGLVVARGWGTATVLVKPAGFAEDEVRRLRGWADERGFDLDWYPGLDAPRQGRHVLDDPALFRAAAAVAAGGDSGRRFAEAYPFDVRPATDARPYPQHFLRAGSLGAFLERGRGEWLPFAEWGYLALFATLVLSIVLATGLLVLPAVLRPRGGDGLPPRALLAYFGAIGLGYLAAEIAAIQVASLLLGHPVYGVAGALAAILACSGVGSVWSDRVPERRAGLVGALLAAVLAACALLLLPLAHVFTRAALPLRAAVAVVALASPAFLMGLPFPLGLRALAGRRPERVAWAWAVNGFASVVAAPLGALVALELGSPALLLVAAGAYGVAGLVTPGRRPGYV